MLATLRVRQERDGSRCSPVVDVKASEHASDDDRLGRISVGRDDWRPLAKSLMWPGLIEIAAILPGKSIEMLVMENQNMVKQHPSSAADETLRDSVHVRCPHRNLNHANPGTCGNVVKRSGRICRPDPAAKICGTSPSIVAFRSCCAVHA